MADRYQMWLCAQVQEPWIISALLRHFGSAEEIFHSRPQELRRLLFLSEPLRTRLAAAAEESVLEKLEQERNRFQVSFLWKEEPGFPKRLLPFPDCPYGLFYQGKLPEDGRPSLAVVGARSCSHYGAEMARCFVRELALGGVQIVSGLAMGIDGIAHREALEAEGETYGVLGSGIGTPYPRENWNLYYRILNEGGGVLSEYPMGAPALKHHFPRRNRLISGLSDGVLVVEAKQKSGTLITVDHALAQGKEVYVVPGRLTDLNSAGCNGLIQQGARPVLSPEEILEEAARQHPPFAAKDPEGAEKEGLRESLAKLKNEKNTLASEEKIVYACLRLDLKHFDAIVDETGFRPSELAGILLSLEAGGWICQPAPNYYAAVYQK